MGRKESGRSEVGAEEASQQLRTGRPTDSGVAADLR